MKPCLQIKQVIPAPSAAAFAAAAFRSSCSVWSLGSVGGLAVGGWLVGCLVGWLVGGWWLVVGWLSWSLVGMRGGCFVGRLISWSGT